MANTTKNTEIAPVEKPQATTQQALPEPQSGGSYMRDPATGEITPNPPEKE